MSTQHTPGRLGVSAVGDGFEIEDETGACIAQAQEVSAQDRRNGSMIRRENARRLAACWNACDGFSAEALEDDAPRKLLEDRDRLLAQRKELLEALKAVTQHLDARSKNTPDLEAVWTAKKAIFKAEGGIDASR